MAAVDDILRSYRAPRAVVRAHLAHPRSEPRLFTFLVAALIVMFIAQWPAAARESYLHPEQKLAALMFARAMGLLVAVPLFYLLAALGTAAARLIGGRGDWYGGRLALFWALLATAPLMLLQGLTAGFIGAGAQLTLVWALVTLAFLAIWGAGLRVSQFEPVAGEGA